MPLWAFVLLAVLCLALVGVACACLDDQFAQAFDRALQAPVAVMEAWPAMPLALLAALSLVSLASAFVDPGHRPMRRVTLPSETVTGFTSGSRTDDRRPVTPEGGRRFESRRPLEESLI
jgi:hypothetical protein